MAHADRGLRVLADVELPERYEIRRKIANGGMASVWCAHDRALGRNVAIKLLAEPFANDPAAVRRFKREARAAARLSSHRHVVTIYDVGEATGSDEDLHRAFLVMEYLAGGTVADALRVGEVNRSDVIRWLHQAAAALDYAHGRGVVHRDIKPVNFLLDCERVLHVADFGIARIGSEETLTGTGEMLGTAAYLAPERALGRSATEASDRYSLAVAGFELLVGERPFTAEQFAAQARQHVEDAPPRASHRNPALPAAVDQVLIRGLAKRPEERWPTAGALADAIERGLSEAAVRRRRAGPVIAAAAPIGSQIRGAGTPARDRIKGARLPAPGRTKAPRIPARGRTEAAETPARSGVSASDRLRSGRARRAASPLLLKQRPRSRPPRLGAAILVLALAAFGIGAAAGISGQSSTSGARATAQRGRTASTQAPPARHRTQPRPKSRAHPATATITTAAAPTTTTAPVTTPPPTADTLEARGHSLMDSGNYTAAISSLREALAAASPASLTYAYALFDLGRSLRLAGNPQAAIPILWRRMQIPNQTDVVRQELQLALQAVGLAHRGAGAAVPAPAPAAHVPGGPGRHHGHDHGGGGGSQFGNNQGD